MLSNERHSQSNYLISFLLQNKSQQMALHFVYKLRKQISYLMSDKTFEAVCDYKKRISWHQIGNNHTFKKKGLLQRTKKKKINPEILINFLTSLMNTTVLSIF
eukprot:TRINITY_DN33460_c0_g1_i2.p2 TRINITY_DN33460_c0_g1~~TRINITY_DN33460_c0_g1_i2.p2  ORF type:complete len:103 (-),score=1.88 TRINITY_DN33460_c0_g1_i2:12-320(-)